MDEQSAPQVSPLETKRELPSRPAPQVPRRGWMASLHRRAPGCACRPPTAVPRMRVSGKVSGAWISGRGDECPTLRGDGGLRRRGPVNARMPPRSEGHTSELQSLMRLTYDGF